MSCNQAAATRQSPLAASNCARSPSAAATTPRTWVRRRGRATRRDSAATRARFTCSEFIMSTLTILALIEMFDESLRAPDEISDDVLAGRRTDIRPLVAAKVR